MVNQFLPPPEACSLERDQGVGDSVTTTPQAASMSSAVLSRRGAAAGLAAGLLLAGCGGRRSVDMRATETGAVPVGPPRFGDSSPHPWTGRKPQDLPVHGIDVARWQTGIDWGQARDAGVSFAFIKATEGGDHANPTFDDQWRASADAGIPRGAYHFFYFCTPAEDQARWFIRNVPRQAGSLPPVVDLEWNPQSPTCTSRPDPAVVRDQTQRFSDILARHYGQRPILYLTVDFYARNDMIRLDHEEFWLRSVTAHPSERFPGAGWSFWQYSGTGQVPGITGIVDLNAFAGSRALWSRWLASRRV